MKFTGLCCCGPPPRKPIRFQVRRSSAKSANKPIVLVRLRFACAMSLFSVLLVLHPSPLVPAPLLESGSLSPVGTLCGGQAGAGGTSRHSGQGYVLTPQLDEG